MNLEQVGGYYSEDSDDQQVQSEGGNNTHSTDLDRASTVGKTKVIKKKYQPIKDDGKTYKYEDDPCEYKKARKKIQNRESAARVRGRKKDDLQDTKVQVHKLRIINSDLQLKNARLETENTSLREQLEFMKTLVKNNPGSSRATADHSIDQYLTIDPPSTAGSNHEMVYQQEESSFNEPRFESPFQDNQDSMEFIVLPNTSSASQKNWFFATIFTVIVAVFVVPDSGSAIFIGKQIFDDPALIPWYHYALSSLKVLTKYVVIMVYAAFMASFAYKKYLKKKGKNAKTI